MWMHAAEALWGSALIIGVGSVIHAASRHGLDRRIAYWASLSALAGGLVGGALLGLYDYGLEDPTCNLFARGKSFCGGLVGGALAATIFLSWMKVSVAKNGDLLVTALALGY